MSDHPRIEDLRRRVQKDPASIAFAQLAEECRRAEQYEEAVEVCRGGLALHPGYLSARVTLGRALIELDHLDDAQTELELVLSTAPENLAAIRGLAEIFHRRGSLAQALKHYRAALALARNDPDLERTVTELARAIEPKPPAPVIDGLSFEQMASEFMKHSPPPPPPPEAPAPSPAETTPASAAQASPSPALAEALPASAEQAAPSPVDTLPASLSETPLEAHEALPSEPPSAPPEEAPADDSAPSNAQTTIARLDQWLDAIHVSRAQRRP